MKTDTLESLATVANEAHACGEADVRKSLAHFRTAGEALIEAKRQVGHGGWMTWMKENLRFGYRQAARYMLLARSGDGKLDSETNLSDALDALANGNQSRLAGRERRREAEAKRAKLRAEAAASTAPHATIRVGDFRETLSDVPDGSVDLIFTDPPYETKALPLYDDLGTLAARILKPDGSLVCYAPTYNLLEVAERVRRSLPFWTTITIRHTGRISTLSYYKFHVVAKHLLWFVKGRYRGDWMMNLIDGDPPHKEFHEWAQGEGEASYCVERMCPPGGVVVDPMCGSGTTLLAALKWDRRGLGCEIDPARAEVAIGRLKLAGHP
jgi:16S rRNA G966 N2-methylase RsmD